MTEDCQLISLFVLFVVVYQTSSVGCSAQLYLGDSCMSEGTPGTCKNIQNCSIAIERLRRGRIPFRCGFEGMLPIVCCPVESTTTSRPEATAITPTTATTTLRPDTTSRMSQTATAPQPQTTVHWLSGVATLSVTPTTPLIAAGSNTAPISPVAGQRVREETDHKALAMRKCVEYSRWVYKFEIAPINLPETSMNNVSLCKLDGVPLIVGGENANPAEFPHMVAIGYGAESSPFWLCGGTLISENFVLTAAHCTYGDRGKPKWVQIGDLYLSPNITSGMVGTSGRILRIVDIKKHPNYTRNSKYNDVALLKIAPLSEEDPPLIPPEPIPEEEEHPFFTEFIRPACLQTETHLPTDTVIATGWGRIGFGEHQSHRLLKVQLNILEDEVCNDTYRTEIITNKLAMGIISSQICAGILEGGRDTCQGDSGGPLQYFLQDIYCMYSVVAVTSFGKFCGYKDTPAIYSRVSEFLPWIVPIVWPES